MADAGEFPTPYNRVRAGVPVADEFGEETAAALELGPLWGVTEDVLASRERRDASERQFTSATIRLRNEPDVVAGDQLRDLSTGEVWDVLTVVVDTEDELRCEVEQ